MTTLVLVIIHRILAHVSHFNEITARFIKGKAALLFEDGNFKIDDMKKHSITKTDIHEALRAEANITEMSKVREVYLERNGKISVIPN